MGLFRKKNKISATLPTPVHLQTLLHPIGNGNNEFLVAGKIECHCGSEDFEFWESNDRQIVKLVCETCKSEFLLFDSGKHGWNGFVCAADFLDRKMPFGKYLCAECAEDIFRVLVQISSQGKEDFNKECLSNDDSFTKNAAPYEKYRRHHSCRNHHLHPGDLEILSKILHIICH